MGTVSRFAIIAVAVAALAAYALLAYVTGSIVRWSDAYVALQASEALAPPRGGQEERVRLANAMVESEPPRGMPTDRRLHPAGTLAHLRYDRIGSDGRVASSTEVRALVPSLPYFGVDAPGSDLGKTECPQRCAKGLAESGGVAIARGGAPGLAPEWVLRMPVGTAYDLGSTSLQLQDLEDARPISLPQARYRVTLLEACPARVRVGAVTGLEFHEHATLPIPKGLRTRRWVQLDGCAALAKRTPSRPQAVAAAPVPTGTPPYAYVPPPLGLLVPQRGAVGRAALIVDEAVMLRHAQPVHVRFHRVCRFEAAHNRWSASPPPDVMEVSGPGLMNRTRVALRFDDAPGLYWALWSEVADSGRGESRDYALVVPAGTSVHCHEGELPPPGPDEISLCVPRHGAAEPRAVPDPAVACKPQAALIAR